MAFVFYSFLAICIFSCSSLYGQRIDTSLTYGSNIRVVIDDGVEHCGKLINIESDTLTYVTNNSKTESRIAIDDLKYIKLKTNTNWLEGLGIGFLTGSVCGFARELIVDEKTVIDFGDSKQTIISDPKVNIEYVLIPAVIGGLIGLITFSTFDDYKTIYLNQDVGINVDYDN